MIAYVDSSVLLSRFLAEARSGEARDLTAQAASIVACRITHVEVVRGLAFLESAAERVTAKMLFDDEWKRMLVVEMDAVLSDLAGSIAASTGVRTLDSVHIAAAVRVGVDAFITFDRRQAEAARAFDLTVLGVDE